MRFPKSKKQLLDERNKAAKAQSQWFTVVAALCRQMGGKITISKRHLASTRPYDEVNVRYDPRTGDMMLELDCGVAAKDNEASV